MSSKRTFIQASNGEFREMDFSDTDSESDGVEEVNAKNMEQAKKLFSCYLCGGQNQLKYCMAEDCTNRVCSSHCWVRTGKAYARGCGEIVDYDEYFCSRLCANDNTRKLIPQ